MSRSDLRAAVRAGSFAVVGAIATIVMIDACASNQESVCDSVGNCEQGGSSDWIQGCQDEAKLLKTETSANGCRAAFDDYYVCAEDKFDCHGATAVFPGCEEKRKVLDDCLAKAALSTACGELARKTSGCTAADAGAGPDAQPSSTPPPACTIARDCQARCFLDNAQNVCAAAIDELERITTCASRCP